MPPSITYDGAATISTGGGNGSGSGVKLKLKLKRGQSPPSQGSGQGSRSCQGSRSRSGSESFKSIHRIIHCPRRNTTYEGYILAASQSSSSSNSSSKGRRKKKHHDLYQAQAQDTGTDVSLALAPSAPSPAPVMDYIKHGKGVLHDHTNHTILSGYFQHDVVIGHALQTIYDNSGRYALAQYEGTFRTNAGDGAGDVDDPVSDCGGGGGGELLLRHGKGKIAWHGTNDMYYGEFHNGIMQGMGTFTWGANGDRYEGPFAKGRMHTSTHASGHGHGHGGGGDCPPGKMVTMGRHGRGGEDVFVGGWRKGLMHGWGRKCFGNGDLFCGYYHRDVRQGYGSYHWQNGDVYVGAWDDGRFCNKSRGRGVKALVKMKTIEMDANTDADALPVNGNGNGNDDANDNDNDEDTTLSRRSDITEVYHGEWCGDVAHGNGMKQYSNGDYYLGEFIDDMRHGYGIYKWSNGDVYEGEFVDGLCSGLGLKRMVVVSDDDDDGNGNGNGNGNSDPKHMKRVIRPDGSIELVHDPNAATADHAFRKGMMPLRDMKMKWTLQEFVDMDNQFVFKIEAQKERWIGEGGVSVDMESANHFQSYLRTFAFQRQRFGYLYGKFVDVPEDEDEKNKLPQKETLFGTELPDSEIKHFAKNQQVLVEAIYEPPQECDPNAPEGFVALDDPMEEQVEAVASLLGLRKVGWIFGHPPREKGFQMSSAEIVMAAELQIECAEDVAQTPFVTVKVTVADDGNVSMEAFQVSKQCMEMVAEEALVVGENPGFCYVSDTFTAIQEGKESRTIENNFFLTVVPINQHATETFVSEFPKANRDHDTRQQSHDEMKKQLSKSGSAGWTFIDLLADFNLLIYLTKFLDIETDIPKICRSIVNRDIPLEEGYKLIIASMAGLDGAY